MENKSRNIDLRSSNKINSFYLKKDQDGDFSSQKNNPQIEDNFFSYPKREQPLETLQQRSNFQIEDNPINEDEKIIVKILDKLIGLAIFMLFFGVPLFFTGLTLQGIVFEKQMFFYFWLLLGLIFWIAKSVVSGEMNIRRTSLDFPILGFWLVCLISAFFSVDYWHSFWGSFMDPSRGMVAITAYILAYYFISSNLSLKRLKNIFIAMLGAGAVLIIWTMLIIFGIDFLPNIFLLYVPITLSGSTTSLGIILVSLLPIFMTAIFKIADFQSNNKKTEKIKKITSLSGLSLFLILDLFLIFFLYNYIFLIGFFAGVAVFLMFILTGIVRPNRRWVWLPMLIFVLAIIFKMTGGFSLNKSVFPIEISLNYEMTKQIALESLKNKAVIGSGPATYGYNFSMYRPQEFNLNNLYNLSFFQGTGILAEAISTLGILGTFFLILVILSHIGSQFYFLIKDREKNKAYSLGFFSASIILLLNLLFIRIDGMVLSITSFVVALAVAVSILESKNEQKSWRFSLKSSAEFALVSAFIFMIASTGMVFIFVYLGKIYIADMYALKASKVVSTDSEKAILFLEKTIKFNNKESKYYVQMGQYYMRLVNQEALKGKDSRDMEKIQKYLNNSILVTTTAKNMSKNNAEIVGSLALIYENTGLYISDSLTLAEENYRRAQELDPNNVFYYLELGKIKISMAQKETDNENKKQKVIEAKDFFQKSVDKKNNYSEGYYQLAMTNQALSELDQAIENGTKAVKYDLKNVDYLFFLGRILQIRNKNDDIKLAEEYYQRVILISDNNVNAHFHLGLLYESIEKKTEAKDEYNKVVNILKNVAESQTNKDTIEKLQKMIENIDKGIKNTPESLGLVQEENKKEIPVADSPINLPINDQANNTENLEVNPIASPEIIPESSPMAESVNGNLEN